MTLRVCVLVVATLVVTASVSRADDGDYDDATYHHAVHAGKRFQIGNERSWDPSCQSTGAKITFTQRPAHGTLSMDTVMSAIPQGRAECTGYPVSTVRVFYTPSRGYQGPEVISWYAVYGNGGHRHVEQDLDVLPALMTVHEGQVFRTVPPSGSLDVAPGMILYVDDGSCPAGQIKRMVTGSMQPLIPRRFDCVQR